MPQRLSHDPAGWIIIAVMVTVSLIAALILLRGCDFAP